VLEFGVEDDAAGVVVFLQGVQQGWRLCRCERWDVRWLAEVTEDGRDSFAFLDQRLSTVTAANMVSWPRFCPLIVPPPARR
jgi:hypothetical protein